MPATATFMLIYKNARQFPAGQIIKNGNLYFISVDVVVVLLTSLFAVPLPRKIRTSIRTNTAPPAIHIHGALYHITVLLSGTVTLDELEWLTDAFVVAPPSSCANVYIPAMRHTNNMVSL